MDKEEFCYTISGKESFIDEEGNPRTLGESKATMAKKIITVIDTKQFYIKANGNNQLFNPISQINDETKPSIIDNTCKATDKFISVNETVFNYYLQFLTTKNILWLQKAERERV